MTIRAGAISKYANRASEPCPLFDLSFMLTFAPLMAGCRIRHPAQCNHRNLVSAITSKLVPHPYLGLFSHFVQSCCGVFRFNNAAVTASISESSTLAHSDTRGQP